MAGLRPGAGHDETVTVAVQVNGKRRGEVQVATDASESDVLAVALADPTIARHAAGAVKKVVYVPGRLMQYCGRGIGGSAARCGRRSWGLAGREPYRIGAGHGLAAGGDARGRRMASPVPVRRPLGRRDGSSRGPHELSLEGDAMRRPPSGTAYDVRYSG